MDVILGLHPEDSAVALVKNVAVVVCSAAAMAMVSMAVVAAMRVVAAWGALGIHHVVTTDLPVEMRVDSLWQGDEPNEVVGGIQTVAVADQNWVAAVCLPNCLAVAVGAALKDHAACS